VARVLFRSARRKRKRKLSSTLGIQYTPTHTHNGPVSQGFPRPCVERKVQLQQTRKVRQEVREITVEHQNSRTASAECNFEWREGQVLCIMNNIFKLVSGQRRFLRSLSSAWKKVHGVHSLKTKESHCWNKESWKKRKSGEFNDEFVPRNGNSFGQLDS